jgi:co-chaperonin GroES (HSP10)
MKVVRTLNKHVLVETIAQKEETTSGGIVLPGSTRTAAKQGRILSAANGLEVQPGDVVLYNRHAHTTDVGSGLELLKAEDILAVLG